MDRLQKILLWFARYRSPMVTEAVETILRKSWSFRVYLKPGDTLLLEELLYGLMLVSGNEASRPLGLAKWVWVIPSRRAVSFIRATKSSVSPETQWASAVLIEQNSGRVLYEQNADEERLIASPFLFFQPVSTLRRLPPRPFSPAAFR